MDKEQNEQKIFLEQQLQWNREQMRILDEIDMNLHKMKAIAEYVLTHELTDVEIEKLNSQLHDLQHVVDSLEMKLQTVIH